MSLLTKKLKVTWKKPLHVNDTLSIVLYRYREDVVTPTCENMPTIGELVYETIVLDEGFFDDEVEVGKWHYAIYAKNKAGLSPCVIDTYNVTLDADGDGVTDSLDLYPFNPLRASGVDTDGDGIDDEFDTDTASIKITDVSTSGMDVIFTVVAVGDDIYAWRYKIDNGYFEAGNSGTVTETLLTDGVHTITAQGLDQNGGIVTEDVESFDLVQPSVITITELVVSPDNYPVITVNVEGTTARQWGYRVTDLSNQVVSFTFPQIEISSGLRTLTTTNLTEGQRYTYEVFVLDENGGTQDTDSANINLPISGADYLWGTDVGAGQYGVPEPSIFNTNSSQGSFRVMDYANSSSTSFTISSQSTHTGGFVGNNIYTNSPYIKVYSQGSSIYEEMIPEKWYHMAFTSSTNSDGNAVCRLFINAILCSQVVLHTSQVSAADFELLIGAVAKSSWEVDYAFNGKIDQIAFWDRGISPTQVAELYNLGNGRPYSNFDSNLKENLISCSEFPNPSIIQSSTHGANTPATINNAFGYNVDIHGASDLSIKTVGASFVNHPITHPGGKVSAHAFTPCYMPGSRDGINPSTGSEYTSSEVSDFFNQSTRKVAAILVNTENSSPRYIPRDHKDYAVSCWMQREGRAVGYYTSGANIKGSSTGYLISEYRGWAAAKIAKYNMYTTGPSYEQDSSTYWMYGK
jgi:hypothetical protein